MGRRIAMKLIERKAYLDVLSMCKGTPDIKVITGIRRCGKSKLLDAFAKKVAQEEVTANIIEINFNLAKFDGIKESDKLIEFVEERYKEGASNYLFIDEVQLCDGFEKAINSFHAEERYDIYITGSNAFLSSSDLATLFVGRTFEIPVFPFSFAEFVEYYPVERSIYDSLDDYFRIGGMPGSYLYGDESLRHRYLNNDVLNALIVRDIIQKKRIKNVPLLERILEYLASNIGSLLSSRNIERKLEESGMKVSHKTIRSYISYLTNAFAFYKIRRYDLKGMKYLEYDDKYYLSDISFRYSLLGSKNQDYGHVLENMVAIELLRRGYEVYVGKLYKKEIDFVCLKDNKKTYIQVSYDIRNEDTLQRELEPLFSIKDNYEKILIARTYQPSYEIEGIKVIDPAEWLLHTQE